LQDNIKPKNFPESTAWHGRFFRPGICSFFIKSVWKFVKKPSFSSAGTSDHLSDNVTFDTSYGQLFFMTNGISYVLTDQVGTKATF
jgi:hypothetical protein